MVGDDPEAWARAGFTVVDDSVTIGLSTIRLAGAGGGRGIRSVTAHGIDVEIDGLPFTSGEAPRPPGPTDHPNRVIGFDHLVAFSPDMDRTIAALDAAGLELRRTRTFGPDDDRRRQAFFWLGDVILELVGSDTTRDDGPATLWGVALTTDDLDAAADALGDHLGGAKDAVQPGRRIATVRTRELDISVPIALMSPHGGD